MVVKSRFVVRGRSPVASGLTFSSALVPLPDHYCDSPADNDRAGECGFTPSWLLNSDGYGQEPGQTLVGSAPTDAIRIQSQREAPETSLPIRFDGAFAESVHHFLAHADPGEIMKLLQVAPAGTLTCAALAHDRVLRAVVEGSPRLSSFV